VLVTSDLHFGLYPQGDACTTRLAEYVRASDAEVFVIAGDIGGGELEGFERCLELFSDFTGTRLLVPGNHDLWTSRRSSREIYSRILPELSTKWGFHMLDTGPLMVGATGFIGNVAWYDYSFRNPALGLSARDYERKSLPGVATWNDALFIHWDYSDAEFTEMCLRRLRRHYENLEGKAESVVAVLHHAPFAELLYDETGDRASEFCRAYMGSARFGELLLRCEKVRYVVCGHRHAVGTCRKGRLSAFVAGSEYQRKRLLAIQLPSGECTYEEFA